MPRLLKSETARRLRVGQRALSTAFSLLSTPKSVSHEADKSDGAIELGLVGIAAELAISACLYEILGPGAIIRKDTGFYITAGEALAKFRAALASGIPRLSLLTQGIGAAADHLKTLDHACAGFKVLFTSRAAAVHAGQGASSDVVFCVGKDVAHFFELLAASPKWKPYLKDTPAVPALPKERTIIAQELAAAVKGKDKGAVGAALANIFLVLPDLSEDAPEWLSALERVHVNAKPNDISVLLKSLESAMVGDLMKVGKGASGIATKIDPDNPNAVPIYIAGMKKKFENGNNELTCGSISEGTPRTLDGIAIAAGRGAYYAHLFEISCYARIPGGGNAQRNSCDAPRFVCFRGFRRRSSIRYSVQLSRQAGRLGTHWTISGRFKRRVVWHNSWWRDP